MTSRPTGTSLKTICLTTPWREWATIRSGITIVRARLAIHLRRKTPDTAGTEGSAVCTLTCLKVTILPFDFRKMILPEDKSKLQALIKRTTHLWKFLECDEKKEKIAQLEEAMSAPSFWDDQEKARKVGSENNRLKQTVSKVEEFRSRSKTWRLCANCARKTRKTRKWPRSLWRPWNHFLWKWTTWRSRVFSVNLSMPVPLCLASMRGLAERNPVIGPIC